MTTVNEVNAYKFSDNYRVEDSEGLNVYGCEHNQEEAEALAAYLSNYHGKRVVVVKNPIDAVKASKAIRPGEPYRYRDRETAFVETGLWAKPTRRRRAAR